MKVTHGGPPPPLPRAARHSPPPRSPGERRSLFSSPLFPPVLILSAEGVRSRLPLPSLPRRSRRPRTSPPPRPDLPAPLRSPPGTLRDGALPLPPRGQPPRPRRPSTPGGGRGGGRGWGEGVEAKNAAWEKETGKLSTLDSLLLIHGQSPTQPTYRQAISSKYSGSSREPLARGFLASSRLLRGCTAGRRGGAVPAGPSGLAASSPRPPEAGQDCGRTREAAPGCGRRVGCLPAMGTGEQHCLPPPAAGWRRAGEANRSLPAGPAPAAGAGRPRPLLARLHGAEPPWRRAAGARPGERGPVRAGGH